MFRFCGDEKLSRAGCAPAEGISKCCFSAATMRGEAVPVAIGVDSSRHGGVSIGLIQ